MTRVYFTLGGSKNAFIWLLQNKPESWCVNMDETQAESLRSCKVSRTEGNVSSLLISFISAAAVATSISCEMFSYVFVWSRSLTARKNWGSTIQKMMLIFISKNVAVLLIFLYI